MLKEEAKGVLQAVFMEHGVVPEVHTCLRGCTAMVTGSAAGILHVGVDVMDFVDEVTHLLCVFMAVGHRRLVYAESQYDKVV